MSQYHSTGYENSCQVNALVHNVPKKLSAEPCYSNFIQYLALGGSILLCIHAQKGYSATVVGTTD